MLYCTYDQYAAAGGTVPGARPAGQRWRMPVPRSSACWPLHLRRALYRVLPASPTTATASPLAAMPA